MNIKAGLILSIIGTVVSIASWIIGAIMIAAMFETLGAAGMQ